MGVVSSTDATTDTWAERLRAAAHDLEAKAEAAKTATRARDELVVEAIEAGSSHREVARWAEISAGRVHQILARF